MGLTAEYQSRSGQEFQSACLVCACQSSLLLISQSSPSLSLFSFLPCLCICIQRMLSFLFDLQRIYCL